MVGRRALCRLISRQLEASRKTSAERRSKTQWRTRFKRNSCSLARLPGSAFSWARLRVSREHRNRVAGTFFQLKMDP